MRLFWQTVLILLFLGAVNTARANDQVAFGQYLSGECVTCHQTSGADKGIPSIVGWDTEAFVAVMNSYKNKERENKVMITIAGALSDDEIAALAAFFATLEPVE